MAEKASQRRAITRRPQDPGVRDLGATPFSYFRMIAYRFGDTPERMQAVLEGTGVEPGSLDDPRIGFNLSQQLRQFDNVSRLAGPDWVLQALKLFNTSNHDNLGLAIVSAPTVRAGLAIIRSYVQKRITHVRAHLTEDSDGATLVFDIGSGMTPDQHRAFEEILLFSALAIVETQLPSLPESIRLLFKCAEPGYSQALRTQLGDRFLYGAPQTGIFVPAEYLEARPLLADPSLHAIAVERLDQDARRSRSAEGIRARVERLLAGAPNGRLDAELIAQSLGVSTRSLTRRLAEVDTNLRDLTDAELHRRAARYFAAGNFSMAEISDRLGFADPTGFSRAVGRWKLKLAADTKPSRRKSV
jgi:AraC-like DNA-binding protein